MKRRSVPAAIAFSAAVAAVAFVGGRFTPSRGPIGEWYASLEKPSFTPPNLAFPIVWTTLYILMAWSAFRVWKQPDTPARTGALAAWSVQLAFNAAWSPLFFGARRPWMAFADLVALLIALIAYIAFARKADRPAAWIMVPYLVWVAFAGALNFEIARMNG